MQETVTKRTSDGLEITIATNHIAAFALTEALMPALQGGRVLFIGSGTHNPTKAAAAFGFRGGRFTSIDALARGDSDEADEKQANRDRYATSKMLNTVTAMEWARRIPTTTFLTLDGPDAWHWPGAKCFSSRADGMVHVDAVDRSLSAGHQHGEALREDSGVVDDRPLAARAQRRGVQL